LLQVINRGRVSLTGQTSHWLG